MALTIRELTKIPHLRTHLLAGASGADRAITWAHSIELPTPWEWLEAGDLLMTVGLGIPAGPDAQVAYIESLSAVGASGIAIGRDMQAPELSAAMITTAERCALPMLITAYEVPFVQISRLVATASQSTEKMRLVKATRIYDRVRAAVIDSPGPVQLMRALGEETECHLFVCTNDTGRALLRGSEEPPEPIRLAFLQAVQERSGVLPGILRLMGGSGSPFLVVPIPARRATSLLVVARAAPPAYALLQHVATIAALEVERQWAAREAQRRMGSEILAQLIDARITGATATSHLRAQGFQDGPYIVAAIARRGGLARSGWLHHALAERDIPNLLFRRAEVLYCLMPATEVIVNEVLAFFDDDVHVGISDPVVDADGVPSAAREARWAVAQIDDRRIRRYSGPWTLFGPRSLTEAQEAVDQILGPVIAYDEAHGTDLMNSLSAFLRCNRSWQRTASELLVHKQTLVYRMHRIEELTARKLTDTASVAELWLAVRAYELL